MILRLLLGSDSGLDEDEDVAGGDDNLLLFSPGTPVFFLAPALPEMAVNPSRPHQSLCLPSWSCGGQACPDGSS